MSTPLTYETLKEEKNKAILEMERRGDKFLSSQIHFGNIVNKLWYWCKYEQDDYNWGDILFERQTRKGFYSPGSLYKYMSLANMWPKVKHFCNENNMPYPETMQNVLDFILSNATQTPDLEADIDMVDADIDVEDISISTTNNHSTQVDCEILDCEIMDSYINDPCTNNSDCTDFSRNNTDSNTTQPSSIDVIIEDSTISKNNADSFTTKRDIEENYPEIIQNVLDLEADMEDRSISATNNHSTQDDCEIDSIKKQYNGSWMAAADKTMKKQHKKGMKEKFLEDSGVTSLNSRVHEQVCKRFRHQESTARKLHTTFDMRHLISSPKCQPECPICDGDMNNNAKPALICKKNKHQLHVTCLASDMSCPLCVAEFTDLSAVNIRNATCILVLRGAKQILYTLDDVKHRSSFQTIEKVDPKKFQEWFSANGTASQSEVHSVKCKQGSHKIISWDKEEVDLNVSDWILDHNSVSTGIMSYAAIIPAAVCDTHKNAMLIFVQDPLTNKDEGTVKPSVLAKMILKTQSAGKGAEFCFDVKCVKDTRRKASEGAKTFKRGKFFGGWSYVYDAAGSQKFNLPIGLYQNELPMCLPITKDNDNDTESWLDRIRPKTLQPILKLVLPLVADWDLSKKDERVAFMQQILGYKKGADLHAHHDLVGAFSKSMVLIALTDLKDGFLHFDLNQNSSSAALKDLTQTQSYRFAIPYNKGDVIIVHKDSIGDVVFKHGRLSKDVVCFTVSMVLRMANLGAKELVYLLGEY